MDAIRDSWLRELNEASRLAATITEEVHTLSSKIKELEEAPTLDSNVENLILIEISTLHSRMREWKEVSSVAGNISEMLLTINSLEPELSEMDILKIDRMINTFQDALVSLAAPPSDHPTEQPKIEKSPREDMFSVLKSKLQRTLEMVLTCCERAQLLENKTTTSSLVENLDQQLPVTEEVCSLDSWMRELEEACTFASDLKNLIFQVGSSEIQRMFIIFQSKLDRLSTASIELRSKKIISENDLRKCQYMANILMSEALESIDKVLLKAYPYLWTKPLLHQSFKKSSKQEKNGIIKEEQMV